MSRIINLYEDGNTVTEIAQMTGIKRGTVYSILQRNQVQMRPRGKRPLPVNHEYFDTIDTEHKAFWIGWLSTSGHTENDEMVSISMKSSDIALLEAFKEAIDSKHKIYWRKSQPIVRLRFQSKHMAQTLRDYGIPDNRTFAQTAVEVSPDLAHHYWRGVIDANGSVHIMMSKKKFPTLIIKVCTTKQICLSFRSWVRSLGYQTQATPGKDNESNTWAITVGGTDSVLPILRLLYDGATVFMPRHKDALNRWRTLRNGPST